MVKAKKKNQKSETEIFDSVRKRTAPASIKFVDRKKQAQAVKVRRRAKHKGGRDESEKDESEKDKSGNEESV